MAHNDHDAVTRPSEWQRVTTRSDKFIQWVSEHILASALMFYFALLLPLATLPMSNSVKIALGVISGSWIQWWALPALQRSQLRGDQERDLKNKADHETLTYLATEIDKLTAATRRLESILLHPSQTNKESANG